MTNFNILFVLRWDVGLSHLIHDQSSHQLLSKYFYRNQIPFPHPRCLISNCRQLTILTCDRWCNSLSKCNFNSWTFLAMMAHFKFDGIFNFLIESVLYFGCFLFFVAGPKHDRYLYLSIIKYPKWYILLQKWTKLYRLIPTIKIS